METIKIDFSSRLLGLIEEKNITQKELAQACCLSTQCVSALITGRNNPTGSTVAVLARFFGVSADYLLGLEDDFGSPTVAAMGDVHTSEELRLLDIYRKLSSDMKATLWSLLDTWSPSTAHDKNKV